MYLDMICADAVHCSALNEAEPEVEASARRTARAEKRQRNTHDGQEIQAHAEVRNGLNSDHAEKAHTNGGSHTVGGMPGHIESAEHQSQQQGNDKAASDKAKAFRGDGENIVAFLNRDDAFLYAGSRAESTAEQLSAADGDSALNLLPACAVGSSSRWRKDVRRGFLIILDDAEIPCQRENNGQHSGNRGEPAQAYAGDKAYHKEHKEEDDGRTHILLDQDHPSHGEQGMQPQQDDMERMIQQSFFLYEGNMLGISEDKTILTSSLVWKESPTTGMVIQALVSIPPLFESQSRRSVCK